LATWLMYRDCPGNPKEMDGDEPSANAKKMAAAKKEHGKRIMKFITLLLGEKGKSKGLTYTCPAGKTRPAFDVVWLCAETTNPDTGEDEFSQGSPCFVFKTDPRIIYENNLAGKATPPSTESDPDLYYWFYHDGLVWGRA
jgi:hypothetical protein